MLKLKRLLLAAVAAVTVGCGLNGATPTQSAMTKTSTSTSADAKDVKVLISTSMGDITVLLYGDTPLHRDNFLKLVGDSYYDGVLFHRVINNFMIQTGDPDSKGAPAGKRLGMGGPGYQIDAEILFPTHFHKRGALAAARSGDNVNPERKSSGSQFYIVTGKTYNEATLDQLEQQMQMQNKQQIFNSLAAEHKDSIMAMRRNRDQAGLTALQEELVAKTEKMAAENPVKLTPAQREAYSTVGGAPHLDGTYTVFGEVIDGMDVVDRIEKVATDAADRPTEDVKILSVKVIE